MDDSLFPGGTSIDHVAVTRMPARHSARQLTGATAEATDCGDGPARKTDILFVFRRGREARIERHQAGQGPDDMLYGLTYLAGGSAANCYIEGNDQHWNWRRYLTYPLEAQVARLLRMGFAIDIAWQHLSRLRQADVIVSTVDACGLPIAMLKYLGIIRTPMVYISQGLSDRFCGPNGGGAVRSLFRRAYARFLTSAERVVVLGHGAVAPVCEQFGLSEERVACLPFGIDAEFWAPADSQPTGDYILSVGSDQARDYETLLQAIHEERLRLVTRLPISRKQTAQRVEVSTNHTDVELRDLYRGARFVATPLKPVAQPSGQSATLQAMACRKAVILTRTPGLWEPEHMRHLENCYLVDPYDVDELQAAIQFLTQNPHEAERIGHNARQTVVERYSSRRFAAELDDQIRLTLKAA